MEELKADLSSIKHSLKLIFWLVSSIAFFLLVSSFASIVSGAEEIKLSVPTSIDKPVLTLVSLDAKSATLLITGNGGVAQTLIVAISGGQVEVALSSQTSPGPVPPLPDPDPDPDPEPDPDVPEGHRGLTRKAYDWVGETVDVSADPDRDEHARSQGENYLTIAAGLIASPPIYVSVTVAANALREMNREVLPLGPVRDAWQVWHGRIQSEMEEEWPCSRKEAANRFNAVGDGLMRVK